MYDVVVIGAGPAGFAASIRSAQLGAKCCLIEGDLLGGVCLNWGCIPTKALAASLDILHYVKKAGEFGIDIKDYSVDYAVVFNRKKDLVERIRNGIEEHIKAKGIDVLKGQAEFKDGNTIIVGDKSITSKHIMIATGSIEAELANIKYDHRYILSSKDLLQLDKIPQSMIIIGGGAIGCEFASIYSQLGCKIYMLEATDRLLPREDKEISRRLEAVFKGSGLNIIKNAKIKTLKTGNGVEVLLDDSTFIRADIALISIGRLPSISTLNLEKAGVALKDGKISVDGYLATNIPHIYAVGDVLGRHYLAHVASYEGIKAAENIFYKKTSVDYSAVPNCIFTKPEIGSVGISEEKAPQNGLDCITVKLPFAAVSKARINGETDGFIKVVIDKHTKRVLGAHILGAYASELIAAFGIAIRTGLKIDELGEVIYAHPSLSESILDLVSRVKEQIFF